MKKLYVGNLPFRATQEEIQELFAQHGTVHSVVLINDRETGRPLGVNEAQERAPRPGGGGGGGGRGGYAGGGGGRGEGRGGGSRW